MARPEFEEPSGLEIRDLTIVYNTESGPLDTVRNVSLSIAPGEIYGLVGESGSGKTTLARAVVQYLAANGRIKSGSVVLDGVDLLRLNKSEMRQVWGSRITMVHQDPFRSVNPSMLVGEQIAEMARIHMGMSTAESRKRAVDMLAYVRMPDPATVARRYAHQLSGGQLQRVAIARSLINNPEIVLMDEPFGALDTNTRFKMQLMLKGLWDSLQCTVIFVTHDIQEAVFLGDDIFIMSTGPAQIATHIHVNLPYHRDRETKRSRRYTQLVQEVEDALMERWED